MYAKEIHTHNVNELLPVLRHLIEHYEVNVCDMCEKTGIPRSTYYDFLYTDSVAIERIQKLFSYLGVEVSIKLTTK